MSGHSGSSRGATPPRNHSPGGGGQGKNLREPEVIKYFTDGSRRAIRAELLDEKAQEWAKSFEKVNTSQLRRFYGDVTQLVRQIDREEQNITSDEEPNITSDMVKAHMALLKAKAVYAQARNKSIPDNFVKFFFDHAASIEDVVDFRAFHRIFESVVAYHKFFAKE